MHELIFKFESEILRLKWQTALIDLETTVRRYYLAQQKANFNPAQPRVLAGNSDGGQWTDTGGSADRNDPRVISDATPDNLWKPGAQYAQDGRLGGYPVDLLADEKRGGHTIGKHVNRSPSALIAQAREAFLTDPHIRDSRSGSFSSLEAATKLVNSTLSQNQAIVDQIAIGMRNIALVSAKFESVTGIEAVAPSIQSQPYIRETYGVGVIIVHDRLAPKGYRVWTAFPSNR